MTSNTKLRLKGVLEQLDVIRNEINEIASSESEVQDRYPISSIEYEQHGYNVSSLEDAASFIKDAVQEINDSLEYEDEYEEQ